RTGAQRLRDRGVLGIHRDDLTGPGRRTYQFPADDQGLLVGQRKSATGLQRCKCGAEADGPRDGVEDDVRLDVADELFRLGCSESGVLEVELVGLLCDEIGL